MIRCSMAIAALFLTGSALAQQEETPHKITDSVRAAGLEQAALLYPRLRQFSITHQEQAGGDISAIKYGKDFFKGQLRTSRTAININVPILTRDKNTLAYSFGVIHQFYSLKQTTSYIPGEEVGNIHTYIPMFSMGLTYLRRESLFNKPFIFSVSANGIFNPDFGRRQFTFTGFAGIQLLRTAHSSLSTGLVVLADPSSPVPVFVSLNYFHTFKKANMDLMIDLPYRLALRKKFGSRTSLSLLNELVNTNSFFEFSEKSPNFPEKLTYSTLEVRSGLMAEYRLTKKVVLSVNAGINTTAQSRILENNAKPKDYIISNKTAPTPYVQVGLSLLPFWKGLGL